MNYAASMGTTPDIPLGRYPDSKWVQWLALSRLNPSGPQSIAPSFSSTKSSPALTSSASSSTSLPTFTEEGDVVAADVAKPHTRSRSSATSYFALLSAASEAGLFDGPAQPHRAQMQSQPQKHHTDPRHANGTTAAAAWKSCHMDSLWAARLAKQRRARALEGAQGGLGLRTNTLDTHIHTPDSNVNQNRMKTRHQCSSSSPTSSTGTASSLFSQYPKPLTFSELRLDDGEKLKKPKPQSGAGASASAYHMDLPSELKMQLQNLPAPAPYSRSLQHCLTQTPRAGHQCYGPAWDPVRAPALQVPQQDDLLDPLLYCDASMMDDGSWLPLYDIFGDGQSDVDSGDNVPPTLAAPPASPNSEIDDPIAAGLGSSVEHVDVDFVPPDMDVLGLNSFDFSFPADTHPGMGNLAAMDLDLDLDLDLVDLGIDCGFGLGVAGAHAICVDGSGEPDTCWLSTAQDDSCMSTDLPACRGSKKRARDGDRDDDGGLDTGAESPNMEGQGDACAHGTSEARVKKKLARANN